MLDDLRCAGSDFRRRAAAWHKPLISVIVTHYNYSDFIGDALASLLDQTHGNWQCVVVDDASDPEHRESLQAIVDAVDDARISILWLPENIGQTAAFFAGLERTRGEFVCLLDPDDRYLETFLEEALATHLNEFLMCPIISTDQFLVDENGIISAVYQPSFRPQRFEPVRGGFKIDRQKDHSDVLHFIPAGIEGWHWSTTSSMMFRRAALNYLKPHKPLSFKRAADSYLAYGAHMLGGTLFLPKPLVYRTVHDRNSWISNQIYSSFHDKRHARVELSAMKAKAEALEALRHNDAPVDTILERSSFKSRKPNVRKPRLARWKRSILKRLPMRGRAAAQSAR